MLTNLPRIVKKYLGHLPRHDYPCLNTFLWVSCWLNFALDAGITSMRGLFYQLNLQGIKVDVSTFSKASKQRSPEVFEELFKTLVKQLKSQHRSDKIALFPLDSTTITLTSKLLWKLGYHQVKLFGGLNLLSSTIEGVYLHFGQGHDSKYGRDTIGAIPDNAVGVMDRGFASLKRIQELKEEPGRFFVLRLKNNIRLEMPDNGIFKVGRNSAEIEVRVVSFCDLEKRCEYRLATNLPSEGEIAVSNEEIGEIYRQRWQIELLWKFLKMHLKLNKIITKNLNGITLQIYASLIAYMLLQLLEIPQEFGERPLDKLRYLLAFMKEQKSFVHWFGRLAFLS
jgi:putative transposase